MVTLLLWSWDEKAMATCSRSIRSLASTLIVKRGFPLGNTWSEFGQRPSTRRGDWTLAFSRSVLTKVAWSLPRTAATVLKTGLTGLLGTPLKAFDQTSAGIVPTVSPCGADSSAGTSG